MPIIHTWGESWDMSTGTRTEYSSGDLGEALAAVIGAADEWRDLRDRMEHDA